MIVLPFTMHHIFIGRDASHVFAHGVRSFPEEANERCKLHEPGDRHAIVVRAETFRHKYPDQDAHHHDDG